MGEYSFQLANDSASNANSRELHTLFTKLGIDYFDGMPISNFHRKELVDLLEIRCLQEHQTVVLFTPAVPNLRHEDMDPFETLGKAMSDYHQRICHVPYTRSGFTAVHQTMLPDANAVVVVLAVPPLRSWPSLSQDDPRTVLRSQYNFVKPLLNSMRDMAMSVPLVLVVCANQSSVHEPNGQRQGSNAFGTVLQVTGYDEDTLKDVARAIFFDV